jgi:AraC-like DNA-binding protein
MRETPNSVAARPDVDVLSDVLRAVRLTGAVFFDFDLRSPWVVEAPPSRDIAKKVMPAAQRVIEYHLVAEGDCFGHAVGEQPVPLRKGDLIVFPQGDAHVLSSEPGLRDPPKLTVFDRLTERRPLKMQLGGKGTDRARIVCCFLGLDERPFNPLLAALPRMIHLSAGTGWLQELMRIAANESAGARQGSGNVLSRVAELMFVETIRQHLEALPAAGTGWLAALRDPVAGHALAAMHSEPAKPWTVEKLARTVAVSRSVLAERFTSIVNQPPMQYLALWRMQLASRLLLGGDTVASVAAAVGYESEAAFSRAFKKLVGKAPGGWRENA